MHLTVPGAGRGVHTGPAECRRPPPPPPDCARTLSLPAW